MESELILNLDQRKSLYNDGYIILRKVISPKLLSNSIEALKSHDHEFDKRLGYDSRMTDLINKSHLNSPVLLNSSFGQYGLVTEIKSDI